MNQSKHLGDFLYVIVNSDHQRILKNSKEFQKENERLIIIKNLKAVDFAMISIDLDRSVVKSIKKIYDEKYLKCSFIFTNGGDQFTVNSPEKQICENLGIRIIDGLGEKVQSSSNLLKKI